MPVHGEYRMLKAHADLAKECGMDDTNTFVLKNGDMLSLVNGHVKLSEKNVPINDIYVDGKRIGDIGSSVIRDRKTMSTDGVLVVILNIDSNRKRLMLDPNVTTRGFVVVNENQDLISNIQRKVKGIVLSEFKKNSLNVTDLKNRIILELKSYIIDSTGRRPIIIPMILDSKSN